MSQLSLDKIKHARREKPLLQARRIPDVTDIVYVCPWPPFSLLHFVVDAKHGHMQVLTLLVPGGSQQREASRPKTDNSMLLERASTKLEKHVRTQRIIVMMRLSQSRNQRETIGP